jgi:hypothetical protein
LSKTKYQIEFNKGSTMASVIAIIKDTSDQAKIVPAAIKKCPIV